MKKILIISPHGDDEVLGCGGTILRAVAEGNLVHWVLVSGVSVENGYTEDRARCRTAEIREVKVRLGVHDLIELNFPPARLDAVGLGRLVDSFGAIVGRLAPDEIYLPWRGDAHSDHRLVFEAGAAVTKWFRYPSVKRVLCYETASETEQQLDPRAGFTPQLFVDIGAWIEKKLDVLDIYEGEVQDFPGPRSRRAVKALAEWRGAQCGCGAAEAFMVLRERC